MRGADAASDHYLVRAKIRLKLAKNIQKGSNTRTLFDTAKLKNPQKKKEFHLAIKNKFESLENEEE